MIEWHCREIEDVIFRLLVLPYTTQEIATTLINIFNLQQNIDYGKFNPSSGNQIEEICQITWGKCYPVEMEDINGVISQAYLPYNHINKMNKDYKYEHLKCLYKKLFGLNYNLEIFKNSYDIAVAKNAKNLLLWCNVMQFLNNPRKLFDFEDIRELFVEYILPYQFIFRGADARIYNPSLLKLIGLR